MHNNINDLHQDASSIIHKQPTESAKSPLTVVALTPQPKFVGETPRRLIQAKSVKQLNHGERKNEPPLTAQQQQKLQSSMPHSPVELQSLSSHRSINLQTLDKKKVQLKDNEPVKQQIRISSIKNQGNSLVQIESIQSSRNSR